MNTKEGKLPDPAETGHLQLFVPQYRAFLEDFSKETDRAAVILGAARLDVELYHLLTRVLLPSPTKKDELFENEGPLESFNAKIDMAYRLGLVDGTFARALHLIRKLRNAFAHEVAGCTLERGPHADRVRELMALFYGDEDFEALRKSYLKEFSEASGDFRIALAAMVLRLNGATYRARPLSADDPTTLLPGGS